MKRPRLHRISKSEIAITLCVFCASYALPTLAQDNSISERAVNTSALKSLRAVKVDSAPVMDGILDDPQWQEAHKVSDFHQIRPGNGTEPSEPTELYVVYTEDALYVAAKMYDKEPDQISAPTIRHGQGLPFDDRLVVILDPFNQGRAGYRFETNINGVRHDALYQSTTSFRLDWNTIWETATSVDGNSWIAELEIPFKSLPFDPKIDTWGFNFGRGIRRKNEEMAWVSQNRTYNPSIMGEITGLEGMDQGVGLDIVPSVAVIRQRFFDPAKTDERLEPSLDAFYRLTPSLNAALTVNTDFSATEVDNRQVNLTRFNLFFPEKRDFFLNDSDLFQFGNISRLSAGNSASSGASRENARPYFSRKLGLSSTGAPVDIEYGGRVSGRVGRWNIGTLAIRQDAFEEVAPSDLLIARVSANVLSDSRIGFIYTNGDPTSNLENSLAGADFQYLNNSFLEDRILQADVFFQQSDTPGVEGDNASYGFGIAFPESDGFRSRIAYKVIEGNFNPAMGFVNRSNISDLTLDAGYTHFFDTGIFQTAFAGVDMQRVELLDGGLQSEVYTYRLAEFETRTRDSISARFITNKEVVQQPFTIYKDPERQIVMQPGSYEFNEQEVSVGTGGQRQFSGRLTIRSGDFFNGKRVNLSSQFTWNQSRYFTMTVRQDWNDVQLPQGDFITRLTSLSSQIAFSSTLYWINLVQYDNLSEEIGVNTRLQWIPKAGQEAFIVLNHNVQDRDRDNRFNTAFSDLSLKFRYTFRF